MVSQFWKRPQRKFITHRPWRKYTLDFIGPLEDVRAECRQRELHNLGHMPLLRFVNRVPWGS